MQFQEIVCAMNHDMNTSYTIDNHPSLGHLVQEPSSKLLHLRPIDTLLSFMISCQATRYSYPYIVHPIPNLWASIVGRLQRYPEEASYKTVVSFPLTSHENHNISGIGTTPLLPLHAALCLKYSPPPIHVVEALIAAYPEALVKRTSMGLTALHLASNNLSRDHPEIVELILHHAPQLVHVRSTLGHLPLHLARGPESTRLLIHAFPLGVTEPDNNGNLPLHYAVGNVEIASESVQVLLDAGYELQCNNSDHRLHAFRSCGTLVSNQSGIHPLKVSHDVVKNCIARNELEDDKTLVAWKKFTSCLLALTVSDGNHDSPTILHLSVSLFQDSPLLHFAIARHFQDALIVDAMGRLPLHVALMKKSIPKDVIQDLLQVHPKAASVTDATGRTPLHHACLTGRDFHDGIIDVVRGAPDALFIRDVETGLYPFMMAAIGPHSSLETIYELLSCEPSIIKHYNDGQPKRTKWNIRLYNYLSFLKTSFD